MVTLSEGGFGIKTGLALEEGDEARVRLLPKRGRPIDVQALVWNARRSSDTQGGSALRVFGCVVSDPPASYLRLLEEMIGHEPRSRRASSSRRPDASTPSPSARRPSRPVEPEPIVIVEEAPLDPALPRSKAPIPPPKPDPEEKPPSFRLRVKQVDGPRSRWLEVRARSLLEAEIWIRRNLEGEWRILEVAGIQGTERS